MKCLKASRGIAFYRQEQVEWQQPKFFGSLREQLMKVFGQWPRNDSLLAFVSSGPSLGLEKKSCPWKGHIVAVHTFCPCTHCALQARSANWPARSGSDWHSGTKPPWLVASLADSKHAWEPILHFLFRRGLSRGQNSDKSLIPVAGGEGQRTPSPRTHTCRGLQLPPSALRASGCGPPGLVPAVSSLPRGNDRLRNFINVGRSVAGLISC